MTKRILTIIAQRVRARRAELNLSQEELGERAELHRTYVGAVERAERNLSVGALEKLAEALDCSVGDLVAPQ